MPGVSDPSRTPVIAAVGQAIERDEIVTNLDLAERAAAHAIAANAPIHIERLTMVGALLAPAGPRPASELAHRLRLDTAATRCEQTTTGGNTPQWLVTRAADDIARGELRATLIVGAEAARSHRAAGNAGPSPFNAGRADRKAPDADPLVGGKDEGFLSRAEVNAGLIMPTTIYPAFDSVLARRAGRDFATHREALGHLMAPFTSVAAANPFAWFRDTATPEQLASPTAANRITSEPYTKRMNAFPFVDQAAALLVCSLAAAREAGIPDDDVVFVWSGADATDVLLPTARPDLGSSPAIAAAARRAFESARIGIDDVALVDLYSCFPSAVEMGAGALGMALDDRRGFTVTGGLPYFGGPGNNYVTHSIATMVDRLRATDAIGVCTALGGYVTKHAVGVYATTPPPHGFRRGDTSADQAAIDPSAIEIATVVDEPTAATVEANTAAYDADGTTVSAPLVATLDDGRRVAAKADEAALAEAATVLVGRSVRIHGDPPAWTFAD